MYRITIQNALKDSSLFVPAEPKLKNWAKLALAHKRRRGELTIRLVDKNEIQALNKTYRYKNKPTNILSFKADFPENIKLKVPLLGDLVICAEVVNSEAKLQHKTPGAHWAHIVIHGALHLLGYDHEKPAEAEIMEAKEIKLLHNLGIPNPYE